MRKYGALPTWLAIQAARVTFLPDDYPWKRRFMSLEEWALEQTPLSRFFDFALMVSVANFVFFTCVLVQAFRSWPP